MKRRVVAIVVATSVLHGALAYARIYEWVSRPVGLAAGLIIAWAAILVLAAIAYATKSEYISRVFILIFIINK